MDENQRRQALRQASIERRAKVTMNQYKILQLMKEIDALLTEEEQALQQAECEERATALLKELKVLTEEERAIKIAVSGKKS